MVTGKVSEQITAKASEGALGNLPPSLSLAQSNLLSLSVAELAFDIKSSQITRHNLESRLLSSCRGGRRLIKLDQH